MDPGHHGDEAELFASFNDELFRSVRHAVRTSVANIEDACATAWAQFLRYQPDRDENWRGWLYRTATREAIQLRARELGVLHLGPAEPGQIGMVSEVADPRPAPQIEYMVVREALDTLSRVPERRRKVAALKLAGLKYTGVAATLGLSTTRVDKLLREARALMQAERMHAHAEWSEQRPRVVRLQGAGGEYAGVAGGRDRQAAGRQADRSAGLAARGPRARRPSRLRRNGAAPARIGAAA